MTLPLIATHLTSIRWQNWRTASEGAVERGNNLKGIGQIHPNVQHCNSNGRWHICPLWIVLSSCTQLFSGLQLASIKPQRITLGKMILQTSVKISIFLQDRYNPIAHGILGCVFELQWGLQEWGYYLSSIAGGEDVDWAFFFCCGGERGKHQPPHVQAGHQAL